MLLNLPVIIARQNYNSTTKRLLMHLQMLDVLKKWPVKITFMVLWFRLKPILMFALRSYASIEFGRERFLNA